MFTPHLFHSACRDLEAAAAVIKKGKTCAVFVEPIQGEGGINPGQCVMCDLFWPCACGPFACNFARCICPPCLPHSSAAHHGE